MSMRWLTTRVREGVGLFDMDDRGLLEVRGSDRIRWLDGMITADVKALEKRGEGAGCPALLLTHRGAIVADFHVGRIGEGLLLECLRSELARIRAVLDKMIIADDVVLSDRSGDHAVLGVEGARAADLVSRVLGGPAPAAEAWAEGEMGNAPVLVAGFGWSGERAFQIRMAAGARGVVREALETAAASIGVDCVSGDRGLLEILRVEAGIPALGAELDEDVLPPEARLERAIANNKGCYVGQEIVARLRSRGQVNHLLIGLRSEADAALVVGDTLSVAGRSTGEITSAVRSPSEGAIALAFVRREHAEPGTRVELGAGGSARVVSLPFVAAASGSNAEPSGLGATGSPVEANPSPGSRPTSRRP